MKSKHAQSAMTVSYRETILLVKYNMVNAGTPGLVKGLEIVKM